jgi:hypothetical protein
MTTMPPSDTVKVSVARPIEPTRSPAGIVTCFDNAGLQLCSFPTVTP